MISWPDVAALRRADRALEQTGLERNRLFGHIDAKRRPARFDPQQHPRARDDRARRRRASRRAHDVLISDCRRHERRRNRARPTSSRARDESRSPASRGLRRAAGARRAPSDFDAERRRNDVCRAVADHDDLRDRRRHVGDTQRPPQRSARRSAPTSARRRWRAGTSASRCVAAMVDPQVGNHPALRRQIRRVHAPAGDERRRRRCSRAPEGTIARPRRRIESCPRSRLAARPAPVAMMRY